MGDADLLGWDVPITASNSFHWRHYPGDIIVWCVRWYLRYPLSVAQMAEMSAERGLAISRSFIWRWVQIYGPELDKRCRRHLKPTNKSWCLDETYSALSSAQFRWAWLLTLALRKNRAAIRYGLWSAASVKFLVPFSLLMSAGSQVGWRSTPTAGPVPISQIVRQISNLSPCRPRQPPQRALPRRPTRS